jgi:YfiR/HmsC-like
VPDFLASGGAIDFLVEEDRLQFEVNVGAATDAHLRISANMLALARHVITRTKWTKSSLGFSTQSLAAFQTQNLNMEVKQ